jgi:hypothetical protein
MGASARRSWPLLLVVALAAEAGEATLRDAFDTDAAWVVNIGEWQVRDGVYRVEGTGASYLADREFSQVRAAVDLRITDFGADESNWAGVVIGGDAAGGVRDGFMIYIRYCGSVDLFRRGKILATAQSPAREAFAAGRFVRLEVDASEQRVTVSLDGETLIETQTDDPPVGSVGLMTYDVMADFDSFSATGMTVGNAIAGRVLHSPASTPAAGATVEIYNSMDGYDSPVTRATVADGQGRFLLSDLPAARDGYWLRASADDHGGSTAWAVTVEDNKLTETELYLVSAPPHDVMIDSAAATELRGLRQIPDPQCFGGSRIEVKARLPVDTAPAISAAYGFEVTEAGEYTLRLAAGMHPTPHYWSDFLYGIDGGPLLRASETLAFEGSRYGDRATLTWAVAPPIELSRGAHTLRLAVKDPVPYPTEEGTTYYAWTFDAAALTRTAVPIGPHDGATTATATPQLSWSGSASADRYTVQYSREPDFSNATVTLGGLQTTTAAPPQPLADGIYYWRVKALPDESTGYGAAFSRTARFTVATEAPAISGERITCRAADEAFIRFETDEPCTSRVLWGLSSLEPTHSLAVSEEPATRHRVRLRGLDPMTGHYLWIECTDGEGHTVRSLRRGFCTPRGTLAGKASPFGIFGQTMVYAPQMAKAGVGWYSDYWDWARLEPARGVFNWEQAEQRMARTKQAGINTMVTFWGSPGWVRPSHPDTATHGPEDLQDATDFFREVAAHCAGRVDWWLPWIEPNIARDTIFGFPEGYWANRPHAQTYAAYQMAAYRGAKAGNPDCRVVGMNTAGIDLDFIRRCYDEGAADSFDVMNVHYYAPDTPFETQYPEKQFADLRALMAQYGDAHKPILCSEGGGASSGLPGTDEASQADSLIRIFVISIANGIDKLCWTYELDGKPYGSKRIDMIMWMGLFRFDPKATPDNPCGEPKPSYDAMGTMTGQLLGTEYIGPVGVAAGVRAYRFRGERKEVLVAWAEQGEAGVDLPVGAAQVTIVDREGKETGMDAPAGRVHLKLTGSPVFVRVGQ